MNRFSFSIFDSQCWQSAPVPWHDGRMSDQPTPSQLAPPNANDSLAALKFYVDLANSEKQAIWAFDKCSPIRHRLQIGGLSKRLRVFLMRGMGNHDMGGLDVVLLADTTRRPAYCHSSATKPLC